MSCQARTDRDGSWHCRRCNMFGDRDEKPECLTDKQIGSRAISNIRRELVNGQSTKNPSSNRSNLPCFQHAIHDLS